MVSQIFDRIQRVITIVLMILMVLVVVLATLDLCRHIYQEVSKPPYMFLAVDNLLDIFGMFLLVLIGIELLDTVRAYLAEHVVHEEVILVAALIAIARKVIVLDVKELDALKLIGIGVIIITVAVAYWIVKQTHSKASIQPKLPSPGNTTTPAPER
jgi:uncharacterized membrane protein (DUF373 family)